MNRFPAFRLAVVPFILALTAAAFADSGPYPVEGIVTGPDGAPVAGATLEVAGRIVATTGDDGRFAMALAAGEIEIVVRHRAFPVLRRSLTVGGPVADLRLELAPPIAFTTFTETVTVSAIRADEEAPVTQRNLGRDEIRALSYGQDVPALLEATPSETWYSDSGSESNYSYFSLRGIQQTRINMTYDGVPLNDPAEHAVYFNNFHDFSSAVGSVQIQRGVGASTVGAAAFGGSVNFASAPFAAAPGGELRLGYGSHDTRQVSVAYDSGPLGPGLAVAGRVSYDESDGYREHSGSEHLTVFLNAGWQGERSSLKFVSFSGTEESQLAYLAVDPGTLRENPRFNPLAPEERDRFGQDLAQLQFSRVIGRDTLLVASAYYNGADGWFRLWDDPEARNELLRFGIDQHFVGSMVSATISQERLTTTLGVHYNDFRGDHTLDAEAGRLYLNTGLKNTGSAFGKLEVRTGPWLLYGDLQLRWARFTYEGDVDLGSVDWTFLDPKIGFRRAVSPGFSVYASLGRAQREPTRMDLLLGEDNATVPHDLEAVRPEKVVDLEAGVDLRTASLGLQANVYAMEFSNEIALTGELSEIGLPLRRNVDDSYRRGLEIDLRWNFAPRWTLLHSANLSRNRIGRWNQAYDVYDAAGQWVDSRTITHRDVPLLLTPGVLLNLGVEWRGRGAGVSLSGRHVGEAHLDNTGNRDLVAPAYTDLDLRASLDLGRSGRDDRPRLSVIVNNLLDDRKQYPGGYSYPFITRDSGGAETIRGIPYYYPLAGRSVQARLELEF